jgi:hypothetical protein
VRAILAAATVEGCLRRHNYKFEREASRVPEFSVDLLKAVRATNESITIEYMQREPGSEQSVKILVVKIENTFSLYYLISHLISSQVKRILSHAKRQR